MIRVLKTLAKFSTDIKLLHYIILMPMEMFIRHRKASTSCMYQIMKKDINIFMFEDDELIKLLQLICNIFDCPEVALAAIGEDVLCFYFEKFRKAGKIQTLFYWNQIHLKIESAEKVRRFLGMNYPDLDRMIQDDKIVKVRFDEGGKRTQRPVSCIDRVFSLNSQNIIKQVPGFYEYRDKENKWEGGQRGKGDRDFGVQDRLMNEIEMLLNN